ncbi:MAG: Elongation factor P [Candidatus Jorgensenbacteria bacterium GW2011_GWF2_41_8]|uniref:Elongation factor P n=1 Tax=Candidatus Jorgensenbacteria bacterium GW2011_GWF2_41_8 TaxID=1618667 RepID=A0A0G0XHE9_9BACT|nr:MAG: Elongation factor P [Candidatus Jorgensenbacteria bacterium GW2011_GWF2_41_8]
MGNAVKFLKPNTVLEAIIFEDKVITAELPIKMEFKIIEAPPSIRGDTAQGGVKQAKIETGAYINVPLFIDESDIIRVNTETGEVSPIFQPIAAAPAAASISPRDGRSSLRFK